MNKIREVSVNSINDILDIEKFLFVLKEMKKDELVTQFIDSISKRINDIKTNCDTVVNEWHKMTSGNTKKGVKQFDIMKGDGTIEIGLEATDAETLKNMFHMSGDDIQILREINEYGFITKACDPHHCENKCWADTLHISNNREFYDILHPSNTNVVLKDAKITDEDKAQEKLAGDVELGEDDTMIKDDPQLQTAEEFFSDSCDDTVEEETNKDDKPDPKLDGLLDDWKKTFTTVEDKNSNNKPVKKSSKKSSKKTAKKTSKK